MSSSSDSGELSNSSDDDHIRAAAGEQAALDRIVMDNKGLVFKYAESYVRRNRKLPMEELVQAGFLGLVKAAKKFDPERGYRFSTYAMYWIRKEVRLEALDHNARGCAKRGDVEDYLAGRMDEEDEKHYLEATTKHAAVQYEQRDSSKQTEWLIDSSDRGIEDSEVRVAFDQCVNAMLDVCSWDECMAVWMYHGVAGCEQRSYTRIAKELGIGSAREVREMIDRAMQKVGRVIG